MSHFSFSISFPKTKVSALIPRESSGKPAPFPFPTVHPASREGSLPDERISRKLPLHPYFRSNPPRRTMSMLGKTSSSPEDPTSDDQKSRRIIRKALSRRSEGNLKAAAKGNQPDEQLNPGSSDVPPPPPPKDPVPKGIPIKPKGKTSDKRASLKRGKILHYIPGFTDDEDDARTSTTLSVTSDSDAASSLQTPSTPAESGSSLSSREFFKSSYEPEFTIERESRAIEPTNALTPPPFHQRKKSPALRLP